MALTIAILAGGQSRRMGTDKAMLQIGGVTLLEHTARLALAVNLPVLVAGRACPPNWPRAEVTFIEDAEPGLGPLGGLEAALSHTQASVLALACDLPLLTEDALRWRVELSRQMVAEHGRVTVNGNQLEPLFSIYRPLTLGLIKAQLAKGRRSLQGLIRSGEFVLDPAPDWVAAQLANVNTPEDWQERHPPTAPEPLCRSSAAPKSLHALSPRPPAGSG